MPIFSNRSIADMFSEMPDAVRSKCGRDLLGRLERSGHVALAAEWELLVLRQLAVFGTLELAPSRPGVSLPDAIFQSRTGERLIVEVTALYRRRLRHSC